MSDENAPTSDTSSSLETSTTSSTSTPVASSQQISSTTVLSSAAATTAAAGGSNTLLIVGVSVGCIVALIVIAVIIFCVLKSKRKKPSQPLPIDALNFQSDPNESPPPEQQPENNAAESVVKSPSMVKSPHSMTKSNQSAAKTQSQHHCKHLTSSASKSRSKASPAHSRYSKPKHTDGNYESMHKQNLESTTSGNKHSSLAQRKVPVDKNLSLPPQIADRSVAKVKAESIKAGQHSGTAGTLHSKQLTTAHGGYLSLPPKVGEWSDHKASSPKKGRSVYPKCNR